MAATSRVVRILCIALAVLLVGCASSDADVIRRTVHTVYEEADTLTTGQRQLRETHDIAVLEWAAEEGRQEAVSIDELRALHQQDAQRFGPTTLSFWGFYQEWLAGVEEGLRSAIRSELDEDEVLAFYQEHPEHFQRQDVITVTVVPWRDGRAASPYSMTIDEHNVRRLQEANDLLVAAAMDLQQGEQSIVDLPDGTQLQVTADSRTDGGIMPFDEVVQAAASQLATQRYTDELSRRAGN